MECNKYVEEKIGGTDSAEFREHLAACAGCARDLEELREVRALYRSASTEKYRGGVPRVRRFRGSWLPLAAAAAVLIGVFALILPGRGGGGTTSTTEGRSAPSVFVRIPLEPWGASDVRLTNALDDCWQKLESLEKKP
jgi:anti-sigma factor RsiW